jgi:hypothetical protein
MSTQYERENQAHWELYPGRDDQYVAAVLALGGFQSNTDEWRARWAAMKPKPARKPRTFRL